MPLRDLSFNPDFIDLPAAHVALAEDAQARSAILSDGANAARCPAYVPTPPHVAWSILVAIRAFSPSAAPWFCEWGAGIGLVALLAERAGFTASGVELEPVLVAEALALAAAHGSGLRIARGSYKPDGFFEECVVRDPDLLTTDGGDLFGADVTFVYAWPGEVRAVQSFFANHAAPGAILVLYRGGVTVSAYRQDPADVSSASSAANPLR